MNERPLKDVSGDILAAVDMLKQYGAIMTFESRKVGKQQENSPLRVYTIHRLGGVQVALRMNKSKTTIYLRNTSVSGANLETELEQIGKIAKRYTGRESYNAPSSLNLQNAPYLHPSPNNILMT